MIWSKYYAEIKSKNFSFALKNDTKFILIFIAIILNIFIYAFFWEVFTTLSFSKKSFEICISFFLFSLISIYFPIIMFKLVLFSLNTIKVFYNKNSVLSLDFNQKKYLNEKIKETNPKQKIFFITWLGKKEEDTNKLKRAIYFYANYKYIQYLRKHKRNDFTTRYLIKIFFLTSIAFWGLMLILTIDYKSIYSVNIYTNGIFLFSIFYILYIIFVSYTVYSEKEQDLFFKANLIGFPENYFLLDNNLDMNNREKQESFDALSIVFGVLFTLYLTLAYNAIYSVGVDIKKISTKIECTNSRLNKQCQERNNALH